MIWLDRSHRGDCRDLMRAMFCAGARGGGNWNTPARLRVDTAAHLRGQKLVWEAS